MVTIYHNPKCKKSRESLEILKEAGEKVKIIEYLKNTPSSKEIKKLLKLLGNKPAETIVRKNEQIFKEQFQGKTYSNEEWINILAENPKLMERPIVVKGEKAVIGRPPENVSTLLNG